MVKGVFPMVIVADGSRSLIAAKSLRFLIFIVLSESELSNSMATRVV